MLRRNPQYLTPHEMDALKASIERDGFVAPILVRPVDSQFEVVSGNHRYMAAKELGYEKIPAVVAELTKAQAQRLAINLNTVHGTPTAELMAPFLAELDDDVLRDIHLDDVMLKSVSEFDAELKAKLDQFQVPDDLNHNSPKKAPDCVCPNCGKRHASADQDSE